MLYRVNLTHIKASAAERGVGVEVCMSYTTETRILEASPDLTDSYEDFVAGLKRAQMSAQMSAEWVAGSAPLIVEGEDSMYIIHSVERYTT